ncbi:MAG: hypothetical protein K1X51_12780 [Rhodospirillaceae bacterium]|nr:hypothetical protein [Rhodospirillaceae bacterium]
MPFKYFAYLAIVCAVLLDLYSAKPDATTAMRLSLDGAALLLGVLGLGGLALGPMRLGRRL